MKTIYLDTNVLLAKWSPNYPFHKESGQIISATEMGTIATVFSTIGLCEVVSVVKRQEMKFLPKSDPKPSMTIEFIKRIRTIKNLTIFNDNIKIDVSIAGIRTEILSTYWKSIEIASKIGLKTSNNIHLATEIVFQRVTGRQIDYFVSADKMIILEARTIKKAIGVTVVTPDQFLVLEGL